MNFQIVDEKQSNTGLSIFAFTFTMYYSVSLSLRKSRGDSFSSTYKLSTREVRKGHRYSLDDVLHQVLLIRSSSRSIYNTTVNQLRSVYRRYVVCKSFVKSHIETG